MQPSDRRGVVTDREDAILFVGIQALQPDDDRHPEEFEQVIDFGTTVKDALLWNAKSPCSS